MLSARHSLVEVARLLAREHRVEIDCAKPTTVDASDVISLSSSWIAATIGEMRPV